MMVTNYVTWDVRSDFNGCMPTLGRKPTSKVMKTLIELQGQLQDSRVIGENVIYRIALPEGADKDFEKLAGYHLTPPTGDLRMNQAMIDKAYVLAREERANGQNCVMVLFPSRHPSCVCCQEEGIHTRYSDEPSGLKSLPVDTLILVGPTDADWDEHGVRLAKEKLSVSRTATTIYVNEDF
jgi:hypothetical protein